MTFEAANKKQVWLAGGIGVTPFLGYLRTHKTFDKQITLIYSVRNKEEAVHVSKLQRIANEHTNFNMILHDASVDGFITADQLQIDTDTILYMCGPRGMVLAIKKQMKQQYPNTPIVYEAFSFTGTLVEDIIQFLKQLLNKKK